MGELDAPSVIARIAKPVAITSHSYLGVTPVAFDGLRRLTVPSVHS
jgi:hypothetical protein